MSNTSSTPTVATTKRSNSLLARIAFIALGVLLAGVAFTYAVLYFGNVNGEEFSSDSFRRRQFVYWQIPLIGLQVTPITHTDMTNDLETYLTKTKLFPKPTTAANRWDLVRASIGIRGGSYGNSRILCSYLDAVDTDGESVWQTWSDDNVELAKVVWPAIAKVARQELYSFVPDLFVLARSATTPEQLQQAIDEALADKYLVTAETLQELGQKEFAAELFAEVLIHAPDRADSIQGREQPN